MKVVDLIDQIKSERSKDNAYATRSRKDEIAVMRAMLNDESYEVSIYDKNGLSGIFCPAKAFKSMIGNIMSETTGMSKAETKQIMSSYEFGNSDAKDMINISKEFVNTYLDSGRKLPLGGRYNSNSSLVKKEFPGGIIKSPVKIKEENGNIVYKNTKETHIEAYSGIKASNPYPVWLKREEK